jgi:hypothetical protein
MKTSLLTIGLIATLSACGPSKPADYAILSEEPNPALSKSNVEVQLVAKVDEVRLEQIALELREDRSEFDKLWIFYYLPDMEVGKGAWATTHFTPDLEVEIGGNTEAQEAQVKTEEIAANETVLGKWYEEQITRMGFSLIEREGKLYLRTTFPTGGHMDTEVIETKVKGTRRLDPVEANAHGEYQVIEVDGTLGLYGNDGRFAVGQVVK